MPTVAKMGYLGKPSAGCFRCRTKRTRCDQKRPSCTQCLRAGSQCTGYRDEFSLIFRDQSKKFYGEGGQVTKPSRSKPTFLPRYMVEETIVNLLSTSAQEEAICFFFRNWILKHGNDSLSRKSYFEHIPNLLGNEGPTSPLLPSVVCLGKAGLAKHTGSPEQQASADADYALALRLTNQALEKAEEATTDRLLIVVLLLGLYETNTHRQVGSLKSWTKHMNGVAALLQLRGEQQFRSHLGVRLFAQARGQCIANCIHTRTMAPAIFVEGIPDDAAYEHEEERYFNRVSNIFVRFCNSRIRLTKTDIPCKDPEPPITIPELMAIEAEFAAWVKDCPESLTFKYATLDRPCETVYLSSYHIYSSSYSAIIWNQYRTVRLHLLIMLDMRLIKLNYIEEMGIIPPIAPEKRAERDKLLLTCQNTLKQLALDVCGSVPFFLGFQQGKHPVASSSAQAVSGNILIWPLFTAGATRKEADDPIKLWIIGVLAKITELTGYEHGVVMSQALIEER